MTILITGLVLFLGIHSLPMFGGLRNGLVARMGENGYKGLFTVFSLVGLILIVWGKSRAPFESIYVPPVWGRHLAMTVVPIAFVLFAAANMPGHIRRVLKHPMLIGTLLWALAHLAANGDLASIILFGSFAVYSVVDMISELARGKVLGKKAPALKFDIMAVVGGLVVAAVVMHFHAWLFGAAVV